MDVSRGTSGTVQIKHKKQSSQDSGTFLDWDEPIVTNTHRTVSNDGELSFNSNVNGEFVTVVAVESKNEQRGDSDSANGNFVTVLAVNSVNSNGKDTHIENAASVNRVNNTIEVDENRNVNSAGYGNRLIQNGNSVLSQGHINSNSNVRHYDNWNIGQDEYQFIESEILVYRLPGERLGFGLKFEGGLQTNQKVARLFVQSCADDSPASRTQTPWGHFTPGDELVRINDIDIRDLTRIDCVKYLKESTVVLKLYVRHLKSPSDVYETSCRNGETMPSGGQHSNKNLVTRKADSVFTRDTIKENTDAVGTNVTNHDTNLNTDEKSTDFNGDNSSPPPIPPRKLLKKNSTNERKRSSPKASPRSIVNNDVISTLNLDQRENGQPSDENEKEFYEVDLKLSDQDIDEIIDSLDRSENEEAARNQKDSGRIKNGGETLKSHGKHSMLDINDNVQTNDMPAGLTKDHGVPEAEFYTNLFLDSNDTLFESESDDTGSSHTTAIDRLSLHSSDRISLTSSSSISDIKSLNSYEFDLDSNMDTVIDFDKVLEPLEGSVESLPIDNGPFMMKTVVHDEQIIKKSNELVEKITDVSKTVQPIRSETQDNSKQSPKPLPRTDIQKLKFKSGKKMPPPPPPPVKKIENSTENVFQSAIENKQNSSPISNEVNSSGNSKNNETTSAESLKSCPNNSVGSTNEGKVNVDSPRVSPREKNPSIKKETSPSGPEKIIEIEQQSAINIGKQIPSSKQNKEISKEILPIDSDKILSNNSINEITTETCLYTTVEQISVDHYPKVIDAQEKVPLDASSPTYKSDLSILETIVENDEHNNHLPRLIDFVPKDKVKSTVDKSKKLNSIIYEQQKVVEYFTQQSSSSVKSVNKTVKVDAVKKNVTNVSKASNDVNEKQRNRKVKENANEKAGVSQTDIDLSKAVNFASLKETENLKYDLKESKDDIDGTAEHLHRIDKSTGETSEVSTKDVCTANYETHTTNDNTTSCDGIDKCTKLLEIVDRKADGGEIAEDEVMVNGEDYGCEEDDQEHNRSGLVQDSIQEVKQLECFNKDVTDGSNPLHLLSTSSATLQIDLKPSNSNASDSTGSYALPPSTSSSSDTMISSTTVLSPHQTRLPPDGHEFPHSYQELTHDVLQKCPSMSPSQLKDVQNNQLGASQLRDIQLSQLRDCSSQLPADCGSYTSSKTNMVPSPTMVSSNGLPPLPNSGPPVLRKMSRESFSGREFSREVSPRKEMTPPRNNSGYVNGTNCDTKTETNYYRYKTGDPSQYKYQNKDEKSEKSVRDKIAMFSNPSNPSSPANSTSKSNTVSSKNGYSANSSPTSGHKFVDPLKRPLTREPSPFGVLPTTPTSPGKETVNLTLKEKLSSFKNDEIVSHNYLTSLDVDNSFTQKHYQETGLNCQSESSAYSSLSTSEILSDKNGDCGTFNGYPCKNTGYENSELYSPVHVFPQSGIISQYAASTEPICDTKEPKEIIGNRTNGVTALHAGSKRSDTAAAELYKDKYSAELKITSPFDAYRKFTSENKSDSETKGSHVLLGRSNSSSRTTECRVNDFSSLPRKLKALKTQESRETSPETEGYSSKLSRTISFNNPPLLQSRSHSMVDIYRNNGADSISKLIEKRKKNISKLKGLIIPEKAEITVTSPAICNLPEIRVKPPTGFLGSIDNLIEPTGRSGILKQPIPLERTVSNPNDRKQPSVYERKRNNSVDNTIDQVDIAESIERERCKTASTWDLNDIPKYSPAFKRKSLTVYEKTKQFQQNPAEVKKVSPPKPPRKIYEKINNDQIDALISFDRIKENCKTKISKKGSDSELAEKSSSPDQSDSKKSAKDVTKNVRSFDSNNISDRSCVKSVTGEEKCKDILNPALNKGNEKLKPNDRLTVKKLNILTAYDTETSESDNDSAISSNVSPPLSPLKRDEPDTPRSTCNQQRKTSTNSSSSSTLTSGDDTIHYQPGETPTKRILKPQSVEAVNRKNVLSSAKFRSGDKTNEPVAKDADTVHEDLVRCVDSRLKVVGKNTGKNLRKVDDDEYSSSTLNENDEEDFEFNDECTDKRCTRRTIKVAYLDVVDSADSSDDILSSSDMISEGANSDDEMSVTSSECKPTVSDDWGNTPDEICSKIEEYIDDLEMYSQEIEEKRNRLINERTKRVRRTIESVKIDKFVRTNEFLRNARLNDANDKLNEMEDKQSVYLNKTKTVTKEAAPKTMSRSRVDRLRKDIEENETTETEASVDDYVPNPIIKPSCVNGKLREPSVKVDEIKAEYVRSISQTETVKSAAVPSPVSRAKSTSVGDVRKYTRNNGLPECSKSNGVYNDHSKPTGLSNDHSRPSGTLYGRLPTSHHMRVSSLDSTTSDDSFTMQREQFGSITSIASSTSLISQQELQQLIDESGNQSLDCSGDNIANSTNGTSEVNVLVLHRDLPGNSVGITLAGGSDYEAKEITVHKVISGTPADRDGRLQKGDRILSINGKSMKGLTHKESLAILKAPRSEVVLVVSRWKPNTSEVTTIGSLSDSSSLHSSSTITSSTLPMMSPTSPLSPTLKTSPTSPSLMTSPTTPLSPSVITSASSPVISSSTTSPVTSKSSSLMASSTSSTSSPCSDRTAVSSSGNSSPQSSRVMATMVDTVKVTDDGSAGGAAAQNSGNTVRRGPPVDITLIKDGAGLGFSLEGGKDSPLGDQPLTIKKIFTGGCAEKNGQLKAGDEILAINQIPVSDMSRIEAWSMLKKLNDGSVHLTLRHKI